MEEVKITYQRVGDTSINVQIECHALNFGSAAANNFLTFFAQGKGAFTRVFIGQTTFNTYKTTIARKLIDSYLSKSV